MEEENPNNQFNNYDDSTTCDDNDEIERIIHFLFPSQETISTFKNKPETLQFQGNEFNCETLKTNYKNQHPLICDISKLFSFSLVDNFVKNEYIIKQPQFQNNDIHTVFNQLRTMLNGYYQSMRFITKSILNENEFQSINIPFFICHSQHPIYSFLTRINCQFSSSTIQIDFPQELKSKCSPGKILIFADIQPIEKHLKIVKVYGWGCIGIENQNQISVKMLSPIAEFSCQTNKSISKVFETKEFQMSESTDNFILHSLFAHIISELIVSSKNNEENGQIKETFQLSSICQFKCCSKCNNYSLSYEMKDISLCPGCQAYFHSNCFDSNSPYCSKECCENIFVECQFSHILYPYRILKRCLCCQKPYASHFEESLCINQMSTNKNYFCCKECSEIVQQLIYQLYLQKCCFMTNLKLRELCTMNYNLKQYPEEFFSLLLTLQDDIDVMFQ